MEQPLLERVGLMPSGDAQRVWFPEMIEELMAAYGEVMAELEA